MTTEFGIGEIKINPERRIFIKREPGLGDQSSPSPVRNCMETEPGG